MADNDVILFLLILLFYLSCHVVVGRWSGGRRLVVHKPRLIYIPFEVLLYDACPYFYTHTVNISNRDSLVLIASDSLKNCTGVGRVEVSVKCEVWSVTGQ